MQSPALASILAEARKFNLYVILTQQYFGQVEKSLKDAIYSNVYNYYVFRVSEEDAEGLVGNLNIDIPKEIIEEEHKKGIKEDVVKKRFMTELHPRECLVRVSANGQIVPVFKARTLDIGDSNAQPRVNLDQLEESKPEALTKNMPKKFVEGDASSMDNVPDFSAHNAVKETPEFSGGMETIPTDLETTEEIGEVPGFQTEKMLNSEAELSFYNNPEFDPIDRRTVKEKREKKHGIIGQVIAKTITKLEPINENLIVSTMAPSVSGEIDTESGFGSGNLASILASQSSSREIVNKRKKVKK